MGAALEISSRKTVTTGSIFQWQNGLQNLLICVTSSTCPVNSICHLRGKQLYSSQQIKWLHSNPHQNYGGNEWTLGIFDVFQTLAEILKGTEPGPTFSQLMNDRLPQLSRVWALLPNPRKPPIGKEWILNTFVKKPGELTLSMLEKDQLLEIKNDGGLKSMFEVISNFCMFWMDFPGGSDGKESDPWIQKIPWRKEWKPTPVFLSGNSMGWGAWCATVHEVAKSQTRLSN